MTLEAMEGKNHSEKATCCLISTICHSGHAALSIKKILVIAGFGKSVVGLRIKVGNTKIF